MLKWNIVRVLALAVLSISQPLFAQQSDSVTVRASFPLDSQPIPSSYRARLTVDGSEMEHLLQKHRKHCEALGPTRCRVVEFNPSLNSEYAPSSIKFALASGTAPAFLAHLTKSAPKDFAINKEKLYGVGTPDQQRLEKAMLQAQWDKLVLLKKSAPSDQLPLIEEELSRVSNSLGSRLVHSQKATAAASATADW